jgi:hypothetical protein
MGEPRRDVSNDSRHSEIRTRAAAAAAEVDVHERPTVPPPGRPVRVIETPLHELLYRFSVGDHRGALATAQVLFDQRLVPVIVAAPDRKKRIAVSSREMDVLQVIDNMTPLEDVLAASGLPLLVALETVCELIDRKIVALR